MCDMAMAMAVVVVVVCRACLVRICMYVYPYDASDGFFLCSLFETMIKTEVM